MSEQKNIKVSVIIPTYNDSEDIIACLEALADQDFPKNEFEVIVVDDGSTDNTKQIIEAFKEEIPNLNYQYQRNQGPATARNYGARIAQGDVILFTDADCEPFKNWISEMTTPFFEKGSNVVGVKGAYKTKQKSIIAKFAQAEFEDRYRKMLNSTNIDFVDTYSAGFKKEVFLSLNGFDTSFPVANNEDVEFSYRMAAKGHKMVFNPNAIVYHQHPDTFFKYLRIKFGRAYWRMAVYKSFPDKMKSDSYTPQMLKLQIGLSFLLVFFLFINFKFNTFYKTSAVITAIFLISTIPFVVSVLNLKFLNDLITTIKKYLKAGTIRKLINFIKKILTESFISDIYKWLKKQLHILLNLLINILRALFKTSLVKYLLAQLKKGVFFIIYQIIPAILKSIWYIICIPKTLLKLLVKLISFSYSFIINLPVSQKVLEILNKIASTKLFMVPLAVVMLFLRGIVMGMGIIWGMQSQSSKRGRFSQLIALILCDIGGIFAAVVSAYYIDKAIYILILHRELMPIVNYLIYFPFAIILTLTIFFLSGLYKPYKGLSEVNEFVLLTKSFITVAVISIVLLYVGYANISRFLVILFFINSLVFVSILRLFCRRFFKKYSGKSSIAESTRILIAGTGEIAQLIYKKLQTTAHFEYTVIGFVSEDKADVNKKINGSEVLGTLEDLHDIINKYLIQEVFIALPMMAQEEVMSLIDKNSTKQGIHFHVISNLFDLISAEIDIEEYSNIPIAYLKNENMALLQLMIKRLFDVVVSLIVLIITFPFWFFIMIAIKLESDGAAIFKQERVGKNGNIFMIYKFRTMYSNTDKFQYSPSDPNDKRITKVGAFLRKTSLDELPQLINVLIGNMSLVGPRPEMPFIVEQYKDWERKRLSVKPGLTGLWQIMGRKDLPLHENIEYDFFYIKNQSLILDLTILIKTIPIILRKKGAY